MFWVLFIVLSLSSVSSVIGVSGAGPADLVDTHSILTPNLPTGRPYRTEVERVHDQLKNAIETATRAMGRNPKLGLYAHYLREFENKSRETDQIIQDAILQDEVDKDHIISRVKGVWSGFDDGGKDFFLFNNIWSDLSDTFEWLINPESSSDITNYIDGTIDVHRTKIELDKEEESARAENVSQEEQAFLEDMVRVYLGIAGYLKGALESAGDHHDPFRRVNGGVFEDPAYRRLKGQYNRIVEHINSDAFSKALKRGEPDYDWGTPTSNFDVFEELSKLALGDESDRISDFSLDSNADFSVLDDFTLSSDSSTDFSPTDDFTFSSDDEI